MEIYKHFMFYSIALLVKSYHTVKSSHLYLYSAFF